MLIKYVGLLSKIERRKRIRKRKSQYLLNLIRLKKSAEKFLKILEERNVILHAIWHSLFPVNFAKFLKTPFSTGHHG